MVKKCGICFIELGDSCIDCKGEFIEGLTFCREIGHWCKKCKPDEEYYAYVFDEEIIEDGGGW